MHHDPIQTLRWSARPDPIYDGWHVITVRGRDSHGGDYGWNQLIAPEDCPFFWSIIDDMQDHILGKIS